MCHPAVPYVIAGLGAVYEGVAASEANKANKAITNYNIAVAQAKASQARRAGAVAAAEHRDKVRRLVGAQRANVGARGFDPDAGSYADLQTETWRLGEMDADVIRYNAEMAALGHESAIVDLRLRQDLDDMQTRAKIGSSLLTAGNAAYGVWNEWSKSKAAKAAASGKKG